MKLGNLVVEISADSAKFNSEVDATEVRLTALSSKARNAVSSFAQYSAAATAAGVAIGAALVAKAATAIDEQAKLAQQLNTTSASMATIQRAGEMSGIGMEKIASASRAVTTRLAQAADGTGPAVDALQRLNLSAEELSDLPLDQRIATINQRINETVPAAQQAAFAAQLFGEEAGTAILTLSGDTLSQARSEVELFGLALSDVDAAKVEQANDAMATFGMAADGIIQQMTVQMAPILKAIAEEFKASAEEAGGFGNIAMDAFESVVNAAAFVADAIDGIKRTFELTADALIAGFSWAAQAIADDIAWLLEKISKFTGVDYSETIESLRSFSDEANGIIDEAQKNMDRTLSEPFAGEEMRQFVEDAREAGQAAAEAAVQAREAVSGGGEGVGEREGGEQGSDPELERLNRRIEAIREANMTEIELLREKQAMELEAINEHEELKLENRQAWDELYRETKARHEEELSAIEEEQAERRNNIAEQEARTKQQIMSNALSGLSALMNSENRKQFELGKAAAIANSLISTYQGMAKALELGWPVGPIAAAAVGVAGFAQIQNIRSQSFNGGGGGASASTSTATQGVNAQNTPVNASPGTGESQTMYVSGMDEGELFTGGRVRAFVGELLEYQRDGGQVVLT